MKGALGMLDCRLRLFDDTPRGPFEPRHTPSAPLEPRPIPSAAAAGKTRFQDLNLRTEVLHAIADLGFQYCSPSKPNPLPHTLAGHDVLGKAQTGTGKTAAFMIGVMVKTCSPAPPLSRATQARPAP